ncbi:undecaprenyl diphosphate synthase [Caloranaerobacter azorensis DSM 13643]|uniref:Undecaprenyl diphosphate synthase n=1 Tax=Caloranaerobacter azorensis DSM 13643 TaxID=1121264 RepID=A0A1M5UY36_9FIRM|nr:polyprenyl diphosphate synthase [Caloranaerobacter azorensis]SHH67869.1 undecaprenyl diphosphate synthase [Caloranaerobacter azorensis DSM 13643]
MRIPKHIGIIPDGNRRWAVKNGFSKEMGYEKGLKPGIKVFELCSKIGVKELTFYGFTMDNTKRPSIQTKAFTKACIKAVELLSNKDASLLVVGNTDSPMFPKELLPYTNNRKTFGRGGIKVNFLVNYGWQWDVKNLINNQSNSNNVIGLLHSQDISRIDLVIRWGGRKRLSGFLPLQTVYSDFYFIDDYWPDFKEEHFYQAIEWYNKQDITLGG